MLSARSSISPTTRTDSAVDTPVTMADASDATEVLGALPTGVVGVAPDWRIAFYNRASARTLGVRAGLHVGRSLWEFAPALVPTADTLRLTLADGRSRRARARAAGGEVDVAVSCAAGGLLLLEVKAATREAQPAADDPAAEDGTMRELAHAMAVVADSGALLQRLLRAGLAQCDATAALVVRLHGEEGIFLGASGAAEALCGRRVLLSSTGLDEVARGRELVCFDRAGGAGIDGGAETVLTGPVLVAPLVAHDQVLGLLVVGRPSGAPTFGPREEGRIRFLADYAALALWKAHLADEAQAANEAKSNFLATVSHELRTPLTTLTGYGELLADEILGPMLPPQLEVVERMRIVTHELTAMIDEILTYSSIEAGREIVRRLPVSAARLLTSAGAGIEPFAKHKQLAFVVVPPAADTTFATDADKVLQILVNLAGNAVKFTEHGSVTLSLDATPDTVRFAVRDTGPGINEEDQARLFQPFAQLDGGLTRRHGGTGLGLYIARRLAALLGGEIELESVPGNGSTFTLVLPR